MQTHTHTQTHTQTHTHTHTYICICIYTKKLSRTYLISPTLGRSMLYWSKVNRISPKRSQRLKQTTIGRHSTLRCDVVGDIKT